MQKSLVTVARDTDRIELLKIRFSGIINKAEQTLRDSTTSSFNRKTDEGIKKKKKPNVRAVEAAVRRTQKSEARRKIQLQREREAARAAVLSMKRTVFIDENLEFMEEIEALRKRASPRILGQLGCFLKSEYAAGGDDDEVLDRLEEGEILE